jgi:hypothetical protein
VAVTELTVVDQVHLVALAVELETLEQLIKQVAQELRDKVTKVGTELFLVELHEVAVVAVELVLLDKTL